MDRPRIGLMLGALSVLAALLLLLGAFGPMKVASSPRTPVPPGSGPAPEIQPTRALSIVLGPTPIPSYLPLTLRRHVPSVPEVAGLESPLFGPSQAITYFQDLGSHWVRLNAVLWEAVEPTNVDPAGYNWSVLSDLEAELLAARSAGLEPIVIVRRIPAWARVDPDVACSRIREEAIPEMVQFVQALVARYRAPPYRVRYWEIGNEPDVAPDEVPSPTAPFGCWGDRSLPGYGGEVYAQVLQAVYPAVKGVDPQAVVLFGSLLLDSPSNPRARYLEGALEAGAGPYFDALGVHYYAEHYSFWPKGFRGKVAFLRERLERYGLGDKPLLLTETSRRCWTQEGGSFTCSEAERQLKAQHVVQILTWGRTEGLGAVVWFGLREKIFQNSGLLETDGSPQPAYIAYRTWVRMLEGRPYLRPLTAQELGVDDPRLEGYAFRTPEGERWVIWLLDPSWVGLSGPPQLDPPLELPLPPEALRVYDPYGTVLLDPAGGRRVRLKGPWATLVPEDAPFAVYVDVAR